MFVFSSNNYGLINSLSSQGNREYLWDLSVCKLYPSFFGVCTSISVKNTGNLRVKQELKKYGYLKDSDKGLVKIEIPVKWWNDL